jgi:hypothetical protein
LEDEPGGSSPTIALRPVWRLFKIYFWEVTTGTVSIRPALAKTSRSVFVNRDRQPGGALLEIGNDR